MYFYLMNAVIIIIIIRKDRQLNEPISIKYNAHAQAKSGKTSAREAHVSRCGVCDWLKLKKELYFKPINTKLNYPIYPVHDQ